MSAAPEPPYLCIRESKSFWVETRPPTGVSATLQAFDEGVFQNTSCYDSSGRLWPVIGATMTGRPRRVPLIGSRQYPVSLELGPPRNVDVQEIISRLATILRDDDNPFCEYLPVPAAALLREFEDARTPEGIIGIARRLEDGT